MAGNLTALAVKNAKPGSARREISDGRGLYLIVQPSGAKSWAYRYRNAEGKPCKLTIGDAAKVTLEAARAKTRKAATEVDEERDPAAEKTAARTAKQATDSNKVEAVVANFIERHAKEKTREATWRESKRILEREIVSRWQGRPLSAIRTSDIHRIIDEIMDRGKPAAALRSLQAIRPMFKWAVKRKIIASNPCDGVDPPSVPQERDRTLDDRELRILWRAAESIGYPFGPIVQLLMLLGQRRDEVAAMIRSELDLGASEWTLPAARAKNGKPHLIPLPPLAVSIIEALKPVDGPEGYLFTTTGRTPVSGFGKAKEKLDRWIAADDVVLASWTFHDLRRSLATGCAALGVAPQVVEALLNHRGGVIRGVARVYNRYDHRREKIAALEAWAAHLECNVIGEPANNIDEMRAVRA